MAPIKTAANSWRRKHFDRTFMELYAQMENIEKFVHLLTQTQKGRAYPINYRHSEYGATILYYACSNDKPKVVQAILGCKGVNVNSRCSENTGDVVGTTPMYAACVNGSLECVKLLCQTPDVKVDAKAGKNGPTPFIVAAMEGHKSIVRFLLAEIQDGLIDYNAVDKNGWSAFLAGACRGHRGVTKLLLADMRINHTSCVPTCPANVMDMACYAGSPTLIRILEEKGFASPTEQALVYSTKGRVEKESGILTERRALADDYVLKDTCKSCNHCNKQYKRKQLERCSQCLGVWYCGRKCQKADWKSHKFQCFKRIALDESVPQEQRVELSTGGAEPMKPIYKSIVLGDGRREPRFEN